MALVNMRDMLEHAYRHRYAVGGFDLVSLDFLEAIIAAAERQQAPVILSLAESHFEYYDFELRHGRHGGGGATRERAGGDSSRSRRESGIRDPRH